MRIVLERHLHDVVKECDDLKERYNTLVRKMKEWIDGHTSRTKGTETVDV